MKLMDNKNPSPKIIIVWSNEDENEQRKYYIDVKKSLISVSLIQSDVHFPYSFSNVCLNTIFTFTGAPTLHFCSSCGSIFQVASSFQYKFPQKCYSSVQCNREIRLWDERRCHHTEKCRECKDNVCII